MKFQNGPVIVPCFALAVVVQGVFLCATVFAQKSDSQGKGELQSFGGGPIVHKTAECIPPTQREAAVKQVLLFQKSNRSPNGSSGATDNGKLAGIPVKYDFYPQAGVLWKDIFPNNMVDEDPSSGIKDYECTGYTYDTHQGIDSDLVTWTQKNIGVPIYAALNGTVAATADGNFDEQTDPLVTDAANYVVLDHGNGQQTYYWHMKNGSVAVHVGDIVKAGQQLGLTASSGYSTGPHLHFESRMAGNFFDPCAGNCGAAQSNWRDQPAFNRTQYIREFAITGDDLSTWDGPPVDTTRKAYFLTGQQPIRFWTVVHNVASNSAWQLRFIRPDGSVAFTPNGNLSNPFHRWYYLWWKYTINFNTTGTWKVEFSMNGNVLVTAPFEVVTSLSSATNRPPASFSALTFTPTFPKRGNAVRCTVNTSLVLRDLDYDQVSYRFLWKLNNVTRRDVTIAAISDMFPAESANIGDQMTCTVTPTDGKTNGPAQTSSFIYTSNSSAESWTVYP